MKNSYNAYAINQSGATLQIGNGSNLKELKQEARSKLGRGWTVVIEKIQRDNGIMYFEPEEVARFTIR